MKFARKHILYVVLLGVAGLALVVDRFMGPGGGAVASAKAEHGAAEYAMPAPAAPASPAVEEPAPLCLADRLDSLAKDRQLDLARTRDAFAPGPHWQGNLPAAPTAVQPVPPNAMAEFRRRHELGAIANGGLEMGAVIDGRFIHIGQTLDGFSLVGVTATAAVFQSAQGQVELALSRKNAGQE